MGFNSGFKGLIQISVSAKPTSIHYKYKDLLIQLRPVSFGALYSQCI